VVAVAAPVCRNRLRIMVTDHGSGIPEAIKSRIFEPFFTTKRDQPRSGLGLGLSVSESLIETMGVLLDFHSQVGQGAVFKIVSPLRQY